VKCLGQWCGFTKSFVTEADPFKISIDADPAPDPDPVPDSEHA